MNYLIYTAVALGLGLIIAGMAYGMATIARSAMEAIGRQPEAADKISGTMLPVVAMLEGAGLFAILVCLLIVFLK